MVGFGQHYIIMYAYMVFLPTWCYLDTFSRPTYIFCKVIDSKNVTKQRKLHLKTKIFAEKFARCKICPYLCTIRNTKTKQ